MKTVTFVLAGQTYRIGRDDAFRAARSGDPPAITKYFVEIDGRRYPPTHLVHLAARTRGRPHPANSRGILTSLGFAVKSLR